MKKILSTFAAGLIPVVVLFAGANAQGTTNFKEKGTKDNFSVNRASESKSSNEKALRDFKKNYKAAMNASWEQTSDGSIASFNAEGIRTNVAYNKNGIWQHTIRYYGESNLPIEVRSIVKRSYYDYSISQVEEITLSDKTVYLVHVDGNSDRKMLRIADGEMQVMVEVKK